jgi:glycosyltransferase involved in cell wall biosynthesis
VNIVHAVHLYPPSIGGTQFCVRELSLELAKMGHRVRIFTTDALEMDIEGYARGKRYLGDTVSVDSGVTVFRFHVFNSPILKLLLKHTWLISSGMRKIGLLQQDVHDYVDALHFSPLFPKLYLTLLESENLDIVDSTPFPGGYNLFLGRICRKKNIPFVITPRVHTLEPFYARHFLTKVARESNALIVSTRYEKEYFVKKGILADRIHVVGIGVSPENFRKGNAEAFRTECKIPGDNKVVLFIGKMGPAKNIDLLVESMKDVWKRRPETYLVILGGSTGNTLEMKKTFEREKKIIILSDVSEKEKVDALSCSNLLVLPSLFESFGRVFLEAWISGKPVIGARTRVSESIIDEEEDGLLFNVPDAKELARKIVFLLENEDVAEEMGRKGREKTLRYYTWKETAKRTLEVYESLQK